MALENLSTDIKQLLFDFTSTAKADNFDLNVTLSKFPELQQVDRQLLFDFISTAQADNFDLNVTIPKFPEITGEFQKDEEQAGEPGKQTTPTIYRGTPLAGEDPSMSSGEDGVQDTTSQEEAKDKEEEDEKFEGYKEKFGRDMHGSVTALGMLTEQQKIDLFGENHLMQSEEWKLGVLNSKRNSGEWDGTVGGGTVDGVASASMNIDELDANWEIERKFEEETEGMSDLEKENIKGQRLRKAIEIQEKGALNVAPEFMDVDIPMTIVGQDDDTIVGFYEDARDEITGDLLFPGLEVSNVGGGVTGTRLNFVLPTG